MRSKIARRRSTCEFINMASRPNEGKKLTNVDGYIHAVSKVKSSASGVRYFDFKIQERDEKRRAICFSPEKRDAIKEKEECKSPVRLLNVSPQKRKFEPPQNIS